MPKDVECFALLASSHHDMFACSLMQRRSVALAYRRPSGSSSSPISATKVASSSSAAACMAALNVLWIAHVSAHLVRVRSGGDHSAVGEGGWRDGMSVVCDGLCGELLISGDVA